MASVVILHLLRLVKDGSVAYVEARRPRNILLNLVHPSCPLALNLQLNSFGQGISIIFCSWWMETYLQQCFQDLFLGTFGVEVYPSPCLLQWLIPQT